jgi:hypothetical protein
VDQGLLIVFKLTFIFLNWVVIDLIILLELLDVSCKDIAILSYDGFCCLGYFKKNL